MGGKREIRCNNCLQWTLWQGNLYDRCLHCGNYLEKEAFTKEVEKNILKQVRIEKDRFIIKEDDSNYIRNFKRTGQFFRKILYYFQVAFLAFISFLLWLISLMAG